MGGRHTECACYTNASPLRMVSEPNAHSVAYDALDALIALKTLDLHHSLRLTWKTSPVLAV